MVNTLTFVSDFGKYPLDTIWAPTDPRYGESTQHMLASGEWTWGGQPTNRDGIVNYNDPLAGGASRLGVTNDPGTGDPVPTCTAWDFSGDFTLDSWPEGGPTQVVFLSIAGRPNPPYAPATGPGLRIGFNRAGNFFSLDQSRSHTESTGLTFSGGTIGVHIEVTPGGPWWVQISVNGALARTYCGNTWAGGSCTAPPGASRASPGAARPRWCSRPPPSPARWARRPARWSAPTPPSSPPPAPGPCGGRSSGRWGP